ncbi:MAG TPA: hypothetical protein VGJ70_03960 [Solirubrobacteraceae bacterium]
MTDQETGARRPPTEEELQAAYEAELKRIHVDDVLVQTVVSLLNLGGRRAGLAPGAEDERDLEQVRAAIEGVRALLPLVEPKLGPDAGQLRQALSQLQMAYARLSGASAPGESQPPSAPPEAPGQGPGPGPAQSSGKLWVPGQ